MKEGGSGIRENIGKIEGQDGPDRPHRKAKGYKN